MWLFHCHFEECGTRDTLGNGTLRTSTREGMGGVGEKLTKKKGPRRPGGWVPSRAAGPAGGLGAGALAFRTCTPSQGQLPPMGHVHGCSLQHSLFPSPEPARHNVFPGGRLRVFNALLVDSNGLLWQERLRRNLLRKHSNNATRRAEPVRLGCGPPSGSVQSPRGREKSKRGRVVVLSCKRKLTF